MDGWVDGWEGGEERRCEQTGCCIRSHFLLMICVSDDTQPLRILCTLPSPPFPPASAPPVTSSAVRKLDLRMRASRSPTMMTAQRLRLVLQRGPRSGQRGISGELVTSGHFQGTRVPLEGLGQD